MRHFPKRATWTGAVLGALAAFLTFTLQAHAWAGMETEEMHQTYPLASNGRIELENVNGPVHIKAWDRDEVKLDAIKRAGSKRDLDEVQIEVRSDKDSLSIRTKYPKGNHTWTRDNPGSVDYALMVPPQFTAHRYQSREWQSRGGRHQRRNSRLVREWTTYCAESRRSNGAFHCQRKAGG